MRGELDACRVVEVPTPEEEDAKRPHREYERLVKERTSHGARVKALLFAQGVRDFDPMARDRLERLAELAIPPKLKAELTRECRRLAGVIDDIADVEAEMAAVVVPAKRAKAKSAAAPAPSHVQANAAQLFRLKGIGVHFGTGAGRRGLLSNVQEPARRRAIHRARAFAVSERRHGARPGHRQGRQRPGAQGDDRAGVAHGAGISR